MTPVHEDWCIRECAVLCRWSPCLSARTLRCSRPVELRNPCADQSLCERFTGGCIYRNWSQARRRIVHWTSLHGAVLFSSCRMRNNSSKKKKKKKARSAFAPHMNEPQSRCRSDSAQLYLELCISLNCSLRPVRRRCRVAELTVRLCR